MVLCYVMEEIGINVCEGKGENKCSNIRRDEG